MPFPVGTVFRIIPSSSRVSTGLRALGWSVATCDRSPQRLARMRSSSGQWSRSTLVPAGSSIDPVERIRFRSMTSTIPVSLPPTASSAPSGEYSAAPKKNGTG